MPKHSGAPIIIKKVKKSGHEAHHGGAWKVAYADFVTAMMAFFLLLWLLNVTTDVQKRGIADYFDPSLASKSTSGAGGVLGGRTIGSPGSQVVSMSQPSFNISRAALGSSSDGDQNDDNSNTNDDQNNTGGSARADQNDDSAATTSQVQQAKKLTPEEMEQQLAAREQKRFDEAKTALLQAVKEVPALRALAKNLMIDETQQGLRIQIVDQDNAPMFPLGSAEMLDSAKKLMALITEVIKRLPNKISITGHTDSTQYAFSAKYTNWELSADRANASRRQFIADGLPPDRIARVVGVADTEPLDKKNPASPHNRRISIVLLREIKEPVTANATPAADKAAAATPAPAGSADAAATTTAGSGQSSAALRTTTSQDTTSQAAGPATP